MSAILAILMMLSGAILIPHAFAAEPIGATPSAMGANPISIVKSHSTFPPGSQFTVNLTITGVTGLYTWGAGLYFDPTDLEVVAITEGPFLKQGGATLFLPGAIDNVGGSVATCGDTLTGTSPAVSGSGVLMSITFQVLAHPYTGTSPGTAVQDMGLTVNEQDPSGITLLDYYANDITPLESAITNGTFTLTVTPVPPVASFSITSPVTPPYYVSDILTFDGSASLAGSDGVTPFDSPITNYNWNFGDGNITNTAGPIVTHSYPTAGPETITLIVTDAYPQSSTPYPKTISVIVKPTGCITDAFTQNWRYIDPITIMNVPRGKGYNQTAELFRPGDLVQVFVVTSYNGDPVQSQMVAIEVFDNQHNIVLTGIETTNATGCGEYDFRVPYPCTGVINEFGTWEVFVTWEIGTNTGLPPFSHTQNDTLYFNIGWGVWSSDLSVGGPYKVGDPMAIKYTLHNDYMESVTVLNTVTVYDDLNVPVGYTTESVVVPAQSAVLVTVPTITLPKWTFVGSGTVKADELTTFPSGLGTAWGPEQSAGFVILHTNNPSDP